MRSVYTIRRCTITSFFCAKGYWHGIPIHVGLVSYKPKKFGYSDNIQTRSKNLFFEGNKNMVSLHDDSLCNIRREHLEHDALHRRSHQHRDGHRLGHNLHTVSGIDVPFDNRSWNDQCCPSLSDIHKAHRPPVHPIEKPERESLYGGSPPHKPTKWRLIIVLSLYPNHRKGGSPNSRGIPFM